jgi:TetR/AcrR family transcriptional regulator, cholesterol catabolism regulator
MTTVRLAAGERRAQILDAAAEHFAQRGYEDTRWADIAAAVGVGPTALYHYFESKQHCLFELMADSVAGFRGRFDAAVSEHDDWREALVAALRNGFDLSEQDLNRRRVLAAEHGRSRSQTGSPHEEASRESARARKRDLEFAWGAFLARGMEQGIVPERDPQLLARSLIGLYNSVWAWYRPGGPLTLEDVGRFYIRRELELLGVRA